MVLFKRKISLGLLLLIPETMILVSTFIFPIFTTIYKSFFMKITGEYIFVGFENYLNIPKNTPYILLVIQNTIIYIIISVFSTYLLGLGAALILNENFRGRSLFRIFILLPWAIPKVVIAIIFSWLFTPVYGLANNILTNLGLPAVNWLTDPNIALFSVIIVGVWASIPFTSLTLLGGLSAIPSVLYDQAKVDGAGTWTRFRFITLPQLKSVSLIVILLQILWHIGTFETVLIMTRGMPLHRSELIGYTLWLTTFRYLNFEQGYAISTLLFLVSLIILLPYVLIVYKREL